MKTEKKIFVVVGSNYLLKASGPVGVAFSEKEVEKVKKDTEYICDSQEIIEVNIWE